MIKKILIANRGEIACRVIRSAKQQHIKTVAVYSEADAHAMHVTMADESIAIGPAPASQSYLVQDKIINAAKLCGADAIHPGYGFLSENAGFARRCEQEGIIFIGPPASAIDAMGSKSRAKQIMEDAGVPLVPGYHGDNQDEAFLRSQADKIGYPVMLKAAAGGGGKGMRQVMQVSDFDSALAAAKREAKASFDCDLMLVEKFLTQPRHVEIQVFCDQHGNGVYLFERDCSVQRRHQKIIEEAPAPGLSEALRQQMGESALAAAKAINYVGAGTVEFLLDGDAFYFMEMNTRLQVEHPVTEMITGEDLVNWQITVAAGKSLPKSQAQLTCTGHAFEVRLYAEDPDNEFLPSTGELHRLRFPESSDQVRIDTGFSEGDTVSVHYDPMLAKLITFGPDRETARQQMLACLTQTFVTGVTTNLPYVHRVMSHKDFASAHLTTHFINEHENSLQPAPFDTNLLPAMAIWLHNLQVDKTGFLGDKTLIGWRMNHQKSSTVPVLCNGKLYLTGIKHNATDNTWQVSYENHSWTLSGRCNEHKARLTINGYQRDYNIFPDPASAQHWVLFNDAQAWPFALQLPDFGVHEEQGAGGCIAPMNGTIVKQLVETGQPVTKGMPLIVMEAMKMEHNIKAPADGKVEEFYFNAGDMVDGGATLLEFISNDA